MDNDSKLLVSILIALFLSIGVIAALIVLSVLSIPFLLLAALFAALLGFFFVAIQFFYVLYAFVNEALFGKNGLYGGEDGKSNNFWQNGKPSGPGQKKSGYGIGQGRPIRSEKNRD